ncbi:MAG: DUF3606 domain-containing protein [Sphingobacteriales bacterium]|jgi:hypothetical protein
MAMMLLAKSFSLLEESAMSDNKSKTAADRKRINVHEDDELRYWSGKFGVTHHQLMDAVKKVGTNAEDVARELGKGRGVPDDVA